MTLAEFEAFCDYANLQKWVIGEGQNQSLPPRLEYRVIDGAMGRGYRVFYLKATDWLVKDGDEFKVMTDEEFKKAAAPITKRRNGTPAQRGGVFSAFWAFS